ncbi:hypothetical protein AAU57_13235 [Nonlabens sp. YIK11]|uniref:hypothetical protein n=1 Tax=Nonlabens sp. YIK11 TaxID=1453349 RepID=UPI0006DD36CE|nr:hypothetical protein [Nonlabens sp. YIK11]KQC34191.1 hypothetical protein AAU57_13235 [Nonlabens sp. YIK11]
MESDQFLQHHQTEPVITPMKWVLYFLVTSLPIIGTVLLLVWAFSNDGRPTRQNWAKGMLLFYVLTIIVLGLLFLLFGAAILAAAASNESNY